MPAKDFFHQAVRHALEREGWTITHDPLMLRYDLGQLYVDLGAEKILAAEREGQKIAVEIKSFLQNSTISEFYTALGQFITYRSLLRKQYPEYTLYLAISLDTYTSFFTLELVQEIITTQQLKLIIYEPQKESIKRWIP
ncbi:element excision factor XisH family protein [Roseofilum sp. BLCC_M154]|uniref:Element excision factor XisH family protein n=1 Tax=Roseofilum acuticapitatum BLCC-M154 TaxID=3022444 RepID=A0ABT7AQJ4_9CYAN|nr:element excision factor XisH family protein [Roseofilum acuticapitatum]MDJ1169164.1 element excision factor XisH family protein [Roseofilum acuticapitatum BLCC-M154]